MKISLIVPTFNRGQTLAEMLETVHLLKYDNSFDYEIIVVDNNSTDNTRAVVEKFTRRNPHVTYIFEPRQGISNARNTGIARAQGEIMAFIDDDVLLDENYFLNIIRFDAECNFDAVGGRVLPTYPAGTPAWIKEFKHTLNGPIVCHDYGEEVKPYDKTMLPFIGANMVIKRHVFQKVGTFHPEIGAGKGSIGEDTEFFKRIHAAGCKIYYHPRILGMHPVEKSRMNLAYIAKWHMASGRYSIILSYCPEEAKTWVNYFGIPRYLYRQTLQAMLPLILSFGRNPQFIVSWGTFFWYIGKMQAYRAKSLKSV